MTNAALFVDLPNFYSRLLKSGIEEPRFLRDYFRYWLDFDLLAARLTDTFSGIWIFYSGERIGPSSDRITGRYLTDYINRINALQGVTANDVNIRGEQREPVLYKCEKCDYEGVTEARSEKGIDASLTVHLFDTMDSWDVAYLLSGDADFVPVVASLRRRGKIVIGAGFSDASLALKRECYDYINLVDDFLKEDVGVYTIFKKDGLVQKWLTDEVHRDTKYAPSETIKFSFEWTPQHNRPPGNFPRGPVISYEVRLGVEGTIDLFNRHELITEFKSKFADKVIIESRKEKEYNFIISPLAWENVKRRPEVFPQVKKTVKSRLGGEIYTVSYQYNEGLKKYEVIED